MSSAQRDHSQPSISVSITQMFASGQPEFHEVELAWQFNPASQSQPASRLDPRAQLALLIDWRLCAKRVWCHGPLQSSCAANDLRSRGATLRVPCRPWSSSSPSRPAPLPGSHGGFAQPLRLLCPAPAITDTSSALALRSLARPPRSVHPDADTNMDTVAAQCTGYLSFCRGYYTAGPRCERALARPPRSAAIRDPANSPSAFSAKKKASRSR